MNPVVSRIYGTNEQVLVLDVMGGPGISPVAIIVHEGGQFDTADLRDLTAEYADGGSWPVGFRFNSLNAEKAGV
jgi:hypothetical protein